MAFDVGRDMLVMRKGGRQRWIVWMWKIIVPKQAFFTLIHFVPISRDESRVKINLFSHSEPKAVLKENVSFSNTCVWAVGPNDHCGTLDVRTVKQLGYELTVGD